MTLVLPNLKNFRKPLCVRDLCQLYIYQHKGTQNKIEYEHTLVVHLLHLKYALGGDGEIAIFRGARINFKHISPGDITAVFVQIYSA